MADAAYPQPRWRVVLDGKDISSRIAPRLMSLTITRERGQDADQLDLTVSDHDGKLQLPKHGVTIDVSLGWDTTGLVSMGTFTVDEVEHSGSPDKVVVRARSAKLAKSIRQKRTQSWNNTTMGAVVNELAGRNGYAPALAPELAGVPIPHLDQTNENDANLLTRLGQHYDTTATVVGGKMVVAPVGKGRTATGKPIGSISITRRDGDQHRYHKADRDAYPGVSAQWHDIDGAKLKTVVAGDKDGAKNLRTVYASEGDAAQAVRAEKHRIDRGEETFELQLARGRADVYPEMRVHVSGFKPQIDATAWLVKRVEQNLGDNGFTTRIECENANAPPPQVTQVADDDSPT